jgi:hypothetical protein
LIGPQSHALRWNTNKKEEPVINEQDTPLTFSDEDFERRYSSEAQSGSVNPVPPAAKPVMAATGRSRNRFMRTLLRRRMLSSAS